MSDQQNEEGSEKSKKQHANKIDHTYIDFSQHDTPSPSIDRTGRKNFPTKLHEIVSNPEYQHIIGWLPHGRSWAIFNKKLLVDVVCANHFAHDKFDSFNRQVNGWGFKRLLKEGPDHKSYYHELFLRGCPGLVSSMKRLVNPGKRLPDKINEPDLNEISRLHPLPPCPSSIIQHTSSLSNAPSYNKEGHTHPQQPHHLNAHVYYPPIVYPPPPPPAAHGFGPYQYPHLSNWYAQYPWHDPLHRSSGYSSPYTPPTSTPHPHPHPPHWGQSLQGEGPHHHPPPPPHHPPQIHGNCNNDPHMHTNTNREQADALSQPKTRNCNAQNIACYHSPYNERHAEQTRDVPYSLPCENNTPPSNYGPSNYSNATLSHESKMRIDSHGGEHAFACVTFANPRRARDRTSEQEKDGGVYKKDESYKRKAPDNINRTQQSYHLRRGESSGFSRSGDYSNTNCLASRETAPLPHFTHRNEAPGSIELAESSKDLEEEEEVSRPGSDHVYGELMDPIERSVWTPPRRKQHQTRKKSHHHTKHARESAPSPQHQHNEMPSLSNYDPSHYYNHSFSPGKRNSPARSSGVQQYDTRKKSPAKRTPPFSPIRKNASS